MVLSKRERFIAIATFVVVGVLVLDFFIVRPLFARAAEVGEQIDVATQQVIDRQEDMRRAKAARRRWTDVAGDAVRRDASEVESQVYSAVQEWGRDARMSLSFRSEGRNEKEKGFTRITYVLTGNGTMEQISRFLHHVQTARIPVRIVDLQIGTRSKEGADELTMTVKIASIYQQAEGDKAPAKPAALPTAQPAASASRE